MTTTTPASRILENSPTTSSVVIAHFEASLHEQLLRVDKVASPEEAAAPELALAVLANSTVSELRDLHVDECTKKIRITGNVSSFYHKQLAQEAMRPIAEGRVVDNQVDVA
ncbi:hypothetical protein SAMN06265222_11144 [Neorhodopirellula lusitana]|uniref:BON domain-containing protein n=1 Tax=Neorhodopirellula lusitana TaxID=445327 RepID=A0ABY1QEJ7_9BACT|nr:hypothetical protein [Neorhodopirellula lusitana]SMP68348.1 hypothetical protein SAMN06265222_11144 [Neorhodopirellula lusitana]